MESPATIKWRTQRISICLRFVALIVSLAGVIAFGWAQGQHDGQQPEVLTEDLGNHLLAPVTGTIEYTLIWSLIIIPVELSTPTVLQPGLYVAFDLIAWIAPSVAVSLYLAIQEPYYTGEGYTCGRNASPSCDGKEVANVEHFGTAMVFLAIIIHLGLFAAACRATDKLRKSQRVSTKEGVENTA
ncbi:uncharacterized protein BDV17DRAFT_286887 [Aspergillus undulatus]|uniref:uncharacterized protein n=1 Tax=Aspergillus undulatus TaxID=1810928 RepID=UPI003CCD37BB